MCLGLGLYGVQPLTKPPHLHLPPPNLKGRPVHGTPVLPEVLQGCLCSMPKLSAHQQYLTNWGVLIHLSPLLHMLQSDMSHGTHPIYLCPNYKLKSLWGHISYPPPLISLHSWLSLPPCTKFLMAFIPPNYS